METNLDVIKSVLKMVKDLESIPNPDMETRKQLAKMAVVVTEITIKTGPLMGMADASMANLAIIETAYKLGKQHGQKSNNH